MRVLFLKLCEHYLADRQGRFTMTCVFDRLSPPTYPLMVGRLFAIVQLEFEPSEVDQGGIMELILMDEDGRHLRKQRNPVEIKRNFDGSPIRGIGDMELRDLIFERPGRYRFDLLYNGIVAASEFLTLDPPLPQR